MQLSSVAKSIRRSWECQRKLTQRNAHDLHHRMLLWGMCNVQLLLCIYHTWNTMVITSITSYVCGKIRRVVNGWMEPPKTYGLKVSKKSRNVLTTKSITEISYRDFRPKDWKMLENVHKENKRRTRPPGPSFFYRFHSRLKVFSLQPAAIILFFATFLFQWIQKGNWKSYHYQ